MTSERASVKRVIMLAGAYVACAIGSGYATGQEIMQFFSGHGLMSIAGVVITTVLFSWCGGMFMRHGYERQMSEPEEVMAFYFGEKLAKLFEVLFQTFLYGVYVVMIAGAGDTLAEYFGLNSVVGRIGMALISFITVIVGLSKLTDILGGMGTAIIVFALGIGAVSFATNPNGILTANTLIPTLDISRTNCGWLWSSILYPGYNAVAVVIISCLMGKNANSSKEAYCGGILGGLLFGVAIMMMNLGILANIKEVYDKAVPALVLADRISPVLGLLFSVIICCGIYTTAVPMLWGVSRNFAVDGSKRFILTALLLTVLGLALGMTSFRSLVGIIYPFSGYIGVMLFIFVAYREYYNKKRKESK